MKTKVYKGILEDEALQLAAKEFGISEEEAMSYLKEAWGDPQQWQQ